MARSTATSNGSAQTPQRRKCATMDVHRRLLTGSQEYRDARSLIENFSRQRQLVADKHVFRTVKIPVVVHVVSHTDAQNISKAQIDSQIAVLNHDFRKKNGDVSIVPDAFKGLVADCKVEFLLATKDPDAHATDGVTRTTTPVDGFVDDDKVKSAATGGADPWPADRYLNIWVCLLGSGLLGYAQFPGGPAQTDGVVITYTAFGTKGTATAPFDLGRSATHEIGHWLNLFHIWGDDGTGCGGTDECEDTPNQGGPNFGVPAFPHVSCTNGPNGDLFMDYMDYVDDAAMVMFTKGQVARMQATLEGVRSSLTSRVAGSASVPSPAAPADAKAEVLH